MMEIVILMKRLLATTSKANSKLGANKGDEHKYLWDRQKGCFLYFAPEPVTMMLCNLSLQEATIIAIVYLILNMKNFPLDT